MRTLDVVGWTCFIHSCTWSWLITSSWKNMSASCQCYGWYSPFCHRRWWASSDCTLLEFHFLVHLALTVLWRHFPDVFANFTHRNSLLLVPLSICIIGFSINLYTVPCLMNGCHLNWSSFFMPAVVLPGLTCHHYIWTCCHCSWLVCILWFTIHIMPSWPWWTPRRHLDGLLTDCMPLHLRAQLALWPFPVSDVTVRLDSFSLPRTVSRSYSTVLWGLFIPRHSWELNISFWFGHFASW
jgi:hypothetical protein